MSRVEDISRALSDSFQEYDTTLRRRLGQLRDGQVADADHLLDVNGDHEVTKAQVGLSDIENYPVATELVIDEQVDPNHYVDLQGAIHYIRTHLNLGEVVDSGDPIAPIGGMDVNTLRPKLRGGAYFNAYAIARKHRRFQLVLSTGEFSDPMLDVTVTGDDLVLQSDLSNLTEYKWRYKDVSEDDVEGPWKEAAFRAAYEIVLTPTLTVVGGTQETPITPTFQASAFAVNTGTDTHVASVWSLYDTQGTLLETETKTTGDLTQWTPSTVLSIVTDYRAEVYYTAATYEQSGVAEVSFTTTEGVINPPTVTIPNTPTGPFPVGLTWEGTDPTGLDTHTSSSLQVATDAAFTDVVFEAAETVTDKTEIIVDSLADLTTYYVRARLHGDVLGYSDWSPTQTLTTGVFEGTTTEIEDGSGDLMITAATGDGDNSVLAGESVQSPGQPVVIYRSPQGVQWAKRLTGIVDEGYITSVVADGTHLYVTGIQRDETKAFVASLDLLGNVRWCKEYTGGSTIVLSDIAVGDKVYVVGYGNGYNGNGQAGLSGLVIALSTNGAQTWAKTIGGTGEDKFHAVGYYGGYVVAVGDQNSDFGTTASGVRCATLTALNVSGNKYWERHWQIQNDATYHDVLVEGTLIRAVGETNGEPLLSIFDRTDGNPRGNRKISGVIGAFRTISTVGGRYYLTGVDDEGSFAISISASVSPTLYWSVKDNQSSGHGVGLTTANGFELASQVTRGGRTSALVTRVPLTGSVGQPPYILEYGWLPWSPSLTSIGHTEAQIYGAWTAWQQQTYNDVTATSPTTSNPPGWAQSDLDKAADKGYGNDSDVRQTTDLAWVDPSAYSVDTSGYRFQSTNVTTFNHTSSSVSDSYYRSQVPNDAYPYKYNYSHGVSDGSFQITTWGSWTNRTWSGGYVHATYNDARVHAEAHKTAIQNDDASDPMYEARNISVSVYQDGTNGAYEGKVTWQDRRGSPGTMYRYKVTYNTYKWINSSSTGYRWKMAYKQRTRSKDPVSLPLTPQTLPDVSATTSNVDVVINLKYSNF